MFLSVGLPPAFSQVVKSDLTKSAKKQAVANVMAGKAFKLMTLDEFKAIAGLTLGDPCGTAAPIDIGQTIGANLSNTDCQFPDGSFADFYLFNGTAGQQYRLRMDSSSIDSYLGIANQSDTYHLEDDDSGGGLSALIIGTLPATEQYVILANSALPQQFGGYVLTFSPASPCTYSASGPSQVSAGGGTFNFSVTTQPECYWQAYSASGFVTSNSTGRGSGTGSFTVTQNGSGSTRQGGVSVSSAPLITQQSGFSFTQPSATCTYSLNPTSANLSAAEQGANFTVTAPTGCGWSVQNNASEFVTANGSGSGNGTVNYSVRNNNGGARSGTITVGGQTFTINQAGLNCTFTITPRQINVPASGYNGLYTINTQTGCTWSLIRNVDWIEIQTGLGSGPATLPYTVSAHSETTPRSGSIQFFYTLNSQSELISTFIDQAAFSNRARPFDFDGDRKTDVGIFRSSDGSWWYSRSSDTQFRVFSFGVGTDKIVPGDYTGDGKTDIAVFRPSTGFWFVQRSEDNSFFSFPFGTTGDVPMPADYDGDGKSDAAVFRPSSATWFILNSGGSGTGIVNFGTSIDKPVTADYDGDGKSDIAIFRPSDGTWWYLRSSDGQPRVFQFGVSTDRPTPGDFTGDGKADIALWRPSNGNWFILRSEDNSFFSFPFGTNGDIPTPGDYDGDGKFDAAVFRPSAATWFINRSTAGVAIQQFGTSTDTPIPAAFVP